MKAEFIHDAGVARGQALARHARSRCAASSGLSSFRILLLLLSAAIVGEHDELGAQQPRVTGFFSNMTYHAETGDVAGAEILIVFSLTNAGRTGQHYAYVQLAEGVPDVPQLVPVTVAGDSVFFDLMGGYTQISPFRGRVVGDSLIGRFRNGYELRMGRRSSYWR